MEADAIGGSINLVTKTAEGPPRGYVAAQYGQIDLHSRNTYQFGLTYGGRFGQDRKLGALIGVSADRNNRSINDVEPAWGIYGGTSAPNEWNLRDYLYGRERYGVGGDLDYRFSANSQLYLKGMWSLFRNLGTVYSFDVAGDPNPSSPSAGTIPGTGFTRTVNARTPREQLWTLTGGGKQSSGAWTMDYAADLSGTRQRSTGYRFSNFDYTGPAVDVNYTASGGSLYPQYKFQSGADSTAVSDAANYALGSYFANDHTTSAHDVGGTANALLHYGLGGHPSQFKFGARYRDEHKTYTAQQGFYVNNGAAPPLTQFLDSFTDPNFYNHLSTGFAIGPVPNSDAVLAYETAHAADFVDVSSAADDSLGSFSGSERILAGYLMNTTDVGALRVNVGLRVEATRATYAGHSLYTPTDTAGNPSGPDVLQAVSGTKRYTDLFPSMQLRYALDQLTNFRVAFTRGIARPNYPDLAPNQSGMVCSTCANQPSLSGFTTGNPNLKAQYAWNYDLLFEHYLSTVGVISGGVFYKDLRDVILNRRITYTGPGPFNGYVGFAPDNGGGGHLSGFEAAWTQRFVFLPGWLAGFGIDANWTHTSSKVLVDPSSGRKAPLLRQSPNIANVYVTYDQSPFSARVGWTYNGPMIAAYGDGTASASGDNYFYAHGQLDGSIVYSATQDLQLQFQVLNINNAPFGFFQGKPGQEFSVQREYYGQTFFFGAKWGF